MAKSEADSGGLLLTLDRGIRVLEEIALGDGTKTAKVLGSSLDINMGTIYQLLRTLQSHGYVHRLPGGRFQLGPRIGFLIDNYHFESAPPQAIIDHLRELGESIGDTVYASLAQGSEIAIVAYREGTRKLRIGNVEVGFAAHPHARASGKVFLAFTEAEDLEMYLDRSELKAMTEHTITDWDELLREFEQIRKEGVAYDREEFDTGIACIGSVIVDAAGRPIGAYSASLPLDRFVHEGDSVAREILGAGERASRSLGYVDAYPPTLSDATISSAS